jgi:hypothetical protein
VKTSIRLGLTALAVSGITFAASGKPLPFLGHDTQPAMAASPVLLPPEAVDGPTPGEILAEARAGNPLPAVIGAFARQ